MSDGKLSSAELASIISEQVFEPIEARVGGQALRAACERYLIDTAPDVPGMSMWDDQVSAECLYWATAATPQQVVSMAMAVLQRIAEDHEIETGARRKIAVAMWQTLDREDRVGFVKWLHRKYG